MAFKKRLLLFLLPLAGMTVFIGINVADYCRYRYIMNLEKHLSTADFEAMVAAVALDNGVDQKDYSGSDMPAIFKKIGAKSLSVFRARFKNGKEIDACAILYERAAPNKKEWRVFHTYACLHIEITKRNNKVRLSDSFTGRMNYRTIWVSDPAREEQTNPVNRILTLYCGGRMLENAWIVTQDAIIYSRSGTSVKQPITTLQCDAIKGGMDMIPSQSHGKLFLATNINGGARMEICFSRDGHASSNDILVHNSWHEELEPLLRMLREFAPHADELPSREKMIIKREHGYPPQEYAGEYAVKSIEEWRACPPLKTDWWIVWPKLFIEKPAVVLETPPELKN